MFHLFDKKVFWVSFMAFFCVTYSFGQNFAFVWATASGSDGRTIPMTSVRLETMRIFNQFDRFHFHWDAPMEQNQELSIYRNRMAYRNFLVGALSGTTNPTRMHYYEQVISWLDSHTNFVFAYRSQLPVGFSGGRLIWYETIMINFVMGNTITSISFIDADMGYNYPTQNAHNRRVFEEEVDRVLAGFPQTQAPQVQASAPSISRAIGVIFGYNFTPGMPLGFTVGYGGFYTSWNFGFSAMLDGTSNNPAGNTTGQTVENGMAFTVGWAFSLVPGILRLPIGIGMSLTATFHQYSHGGQTTWREPDGIFENRRFIMEAGLQLILGNRFYISSTVRGFSSFGFTLGAGFVF